MEKTKLIVAMYENGIGIKKISAILECTELEVYKTLQSNGHKRIEIKNEQRNNTICSLYQSKRKISEIASELGIDRHTVTSVLKQRGLYKNIRASVYDSSKEKRNSKIIELYQKGLSLRDVAKEVDVCPGTVSNVLKTFCCKVRPQHQLGHSKGTSKNRKYHFDENFFDSIDTEEKAYWLGFLYADGYVNQHGVTKLALKASDVNHIKSLRASLNGDVPIKYCPQTNSYAITFCSVKMATSLSKAGCFQKKSLKLSFPTEDQVQSNLIPHFMRGYFDGDGCISISNSKGKQNWSINVIGTPSFLNGFESILDSIEIRRNKRIHRDTWNENTQAINYASKDALIKIFHLFYDNATIFLERKYNRFIQYMASQEESY